jgi:hypothetical protein
MQTTAEAGLPPTTVPRARRRRDDGNAGWSRNVLCGVASVRRYASRSARCVLIRGLWIGAAFHNGRTHRILNRNAARQSWVTGSGELRKRGRRDARTRRGGSRRCDSWRVGIGASTREGCSHFWPVHSSWRAAFAPEQSSREFAPADAAVGTQDAALQIAWISSKLLVCSEVVADAGPSEGGDAIPPRYKPREAARPTIQYNCAPMQEGLAFHSKGSIGVVVRRRAKARATQPPHRP